MKIEDLRKKTDEIDTKILHLLSKRVETTLEIGRLKKQTGQLVYDPTREREILERLKTINKGKFPNSALEEVFRVIISQSRTLEKPLQVVFLGPRTTFTHLAAQKQFGPATNLVAKKSIPEVFEEVEKNRADFGVVPIENSTEGSVSNTLDMFLDSELNVVAEVVLSISQNLLSKYPVDSIKKIYSHPQALAQCGKWIRSNFPEAELIETVSTADGAQKATLYHSSAAIGSELTAREFNLNIVAEKIEDFAENKTRFLVIGRSKPKRTGMDKTSILFSVEHRAGALWDALGVLKKYNLNMTKVESRPSRRRLWEYVFFVDFEGFVEDDVVRKALDEMKVICSFLKVLGSYPQSV